MLVKFYCPMCKFCEIHNEIHVPVFKIWPITYISCLFGNWDIMDRYGEFRTLFLVLCNGRAY